MSPVMSQPPAVFSSGLVRIFSWVKTSNQAKAAPQRNKNPRTKAVCLTNGFTDLFFGYDLGLAQVVFPVGIVGEARHGYSDNFFTRSITSLGWFITSRIWVSTSSPARVDRSSLVFLASSTTSGSLKAFR
jgi:hypothetical protein